MILKIHLSKDYWLGPKTKRISPLFRILGLHYEYASSLEICNKISKLLPVFFIGYQFYRFLSVYHSIVS